MIYCARSLSKKVAILTVPDPDPETFGTSFASTLWPQRQVGERPLRKPGNQEKERRKKGTSPSFRSWIPGFLSGGFSPEYPTAYSVPNASDPDADPVLGLPRVQVPGFLNGHKKKRFLTLAPRRSMLHVIALTWLPFLACAEASAKSQPNFVVIFIDDMGYGDIGPFGSTINRTPHLDQMAAEGMKLTSFYSAAPSCTPSRAALMTGCYPQRVGLGQGSRGRTSVLFPVDAHGLNPAETTIAEVLQQGGYKTGCFGKWHLGDQPAFLPTEHGFDTYLGIPYSNDMWTRHPKAGSGGIWNVPELPLLKDTKVIDTITDMEGQGQLCRKFTEAAVQFIRDHKDDPFFVYLPHAFVHTPRAAQPEFLERAGVKAVDWERVIADRTIQMRARTRAQVEEVDWSVGEILRTLRELELERDTLVIFTSDNGGPRDLVNTPLRGGKGQTWEGGMREPALAWWPGRIPPGTISDEVATTMDLLPTFARLSGNEVPSEHRIDGKDITDLLLAKVGAQSPYGAFFYYQRLELDAVRLGRFKLFADGELYDLEADIGETRDVASKHPGVVARLGQHLEAARRDLGDGDRRGAGVRPVGFVENPRPLLRSPDHGATACGPSSEQALPHSYTIPTLDLAPQKHRQTVVDQEKGLYLGAADTLLLEDNRTLFAVYPKGHGTGAIVLKRSNDAGLTWSKRLPTPRSWNSSASIPTLHRLSDSDGKRRIVLFCNSFPILLAASEDDGRTWSELEAIGDYGAAGVTDVVALKSGPGHYMALFSDNGRWLHGGPFLSKGGPLMSGRGKAVIYNTFSVDGGVHWGPPKEIARHPTVKLNEPGAIRSPDGGQIAVLLRESSRLHNSYVIFSNDEGKTWTAPRELPASLTGDRHVACATPDGRLFVTFRGSTLVSPTDGDWVAWVGTYEDIVENREGQYRVRLMDNHRGVFRTVTDCGYAGVEVLTDGTIVTTGYGHFTPGEMPYIVSVRLKLEELDAMAAARH
jgi:arylsulfatase A